MFDIWSDKFINLHTQSFFSECMKPQTSLCDETYFVDGKLSLKATASAVV